MKSAEGAPAVSTGTGDAKSGGIVRDWVVPILLGLLIGGGLVVAWRSGRVLFQSKVWTLVEKYEKAAAEDGDAEAVVKELHALGPTARADLVKALHDLAADHMETKIWVAHQLAGEPWFDTTSLKEIVRDAKAAKEDHRAAACALVDTQSKEVDAELVLPVLEEWLKDPSSTDRGLAVERVGTMWRLGMLNSDWELRMKRALLDLAKRGAPAKPDDEERIADERAGAIITLELGLPDDEIKTMLWTVAKDETDEDLPRINAVRALSEGGILDAADLADWTAVSKAANPAVRQTVAENLFRAKLPEYDKVIAPMQFDANPLARTGALDTQIKRRRPTMLARFDELVEDSYEWARFDAMFAAGVFKNETEGLPQRAAMMLHLLETSDSKEDVMGAALAMKMLTDKVYGFKPDEVRLHEQTIDDEALVPFMGDKVARAKAAESWRTHFGAAAVWTDADRAKALEKLLTHADPKNVERAKAELEKLHK
jgi:hypothetical protein